MAEYMHATHVVSIPVTPQDPGISIADASGDTRVGLPLSCSCGGDSRHTHQPPRWLADESSVIPTFL